MAIEIVLRSGERYVVGLTPYGTESQLEDVTGSGLGEWVEVQPTGRDGRTLVRRSEIVVVREVTEESGPQIHSLD